MIVPTMTSEELAKEILTDFENVKSKLFYILKKARRLALKSHKKHFQQMFEYISPMKNQWLIFVNYYVKEPVFVPVIYYINQYGLNGIMVDADNITLSHYTSHFLDRYNERFLQNNDLSKLDLLKHFIVKNPMSQTENMPDDKKYSNQIFGRFSEGMGFGYMEHLIKNNIVHFKTFVSSDMRFESQNEVFQNTSMKYKVFWDEVYGYRNVEAFCDEKTVESC